MDLAGGGGGARYSFSDGENGRAEMPMSDEVSSVDERRVLEPTPPPLPTHPLVSVSMMPSMAMPATPTKGGATLLSRIGSVKKWGVRP